MTEPDRLFLWLRAGSAVLVAAFLAALAVAMVDAGMGAAAVMTAALAVVVVLLPVAGPRWWPTGPAPLAIDGLAADHAGRVRAAAAHAERLRQLAEASPEGPVAEHFTHLADTAAGYVHALRDTLAQADIAGAGAAGPALRADADRIVAQLRELELAAERLRAAARRRLETSPLEELTERTRRLTEAIEAPSIDVPTD